MPRKNSTIPRTVIIGRLLADRASSRARARAQSSAASTSATVAGSAVHASAASSTRASVSVIPVNEQAPARNAADGLLVGRVEHRGHAAAQRARRAGEPHAGERVVVERLERPALRGVPPARRRRARQPLAARPARARSAAACPAGWPGRCVEPSANVTIECTIDCGCTTTSIRSYGMPNSRWASISSRPLLISVAELSVTTGPMSHVGWASASATVTSASSARRRPRNGPPDAVSTSRSTSSARPPRRHWASAECSESTGTICPGAAAAVTSAPPATSDSLLASASVAPAASAASVGPRPTAPVMPLSTVSTGVVAVSSVAASGPASTSTPGSSVAQGARRVLGGDGHARARRARGPARRAARRRRRPRPARRR